MNPHQSIFSSVQKAQREEDILEEKLSQGRLGVIDDFGRMLRAMGVLGDAQAGVLEVDEGFGSLLEDIGGQPRGTRAEVCDF